MVNTHPSIDWDAEDLYLQAIGFREECTSFFNAHHREYKEDIHHHVLARQDRPRNENILANQRHI